MRELLTTAVRVGGVTHLVGPVTMVLQGGPRYVNWPNHQSNDDESMTVSYICIFLTWPAVLHVHEHQFQYLRINFQLPF